MAQDGAAFLRPLSATADAPGGEPSLAVLTISAGAPGGEPSLEALTGTGESFAGATSQAGSSARLAGLRSTGVATAGSVAETDADFAELAPPTAEAYGPPPAAAGSFAALTASAQHLTGTVASAAVALRPLSLSSASVAQGVASASPSLRPLSATGLSIADVVAAGSASLLPLQASASALVGGVASAAASFHPLTASTSALSEGLASGSPRLLPLRASAVSSSLGSTYRTWALNVSNEALTEYQNYSFNSMVEFNGTHYAAGPGGIYELDGEDDGGADIDWLFRTGFMDGTNASREQRGGLTPAQARQLKRLEEVLFAARASGPMLLRVWTDDVTYNDYPVESFRPDAVYQFRRKVGKGARSRFFRIELRGVDNTAAEISTMQLPMKPVARRLG